MIPRRTLHKRFIVLLVAVFFCIGIFFAFRLYYKTAVLSPLEVLTSAGESLLGARQYEEALLLFQSFARTYPASHETSWTLMSAAGILNLFMGRPLEAIHGYLLVARDYPLTPAACQAREKIADIYKYRLEDYEQASVYDQRVLVGDHGRKYLIHYRLADCYFRLNNFEQSRIELETFLLQYPQRPLIPEVNRYRIAAAWGLEDRLAPAEKEFRALANDYPKSTLALEAHFEIGSIQVREEKLKKAPENFQDLRGDYP